MIGLAVVVGLLWKEPRERRHTAPGNRAMNLFLLYLLLFKAVITSFSGMASLPIVRNDFVVKRHVLTDRQLNTAIVAGRTGPGPNGLYLVSVGYFAAGLPGAFAGLIALITPAFLIIPLMSWIGSIRQSPAHPRCHSRSDPGQRRTLDGRLDSARPRCRHRAARRRHHRRQLYRAGVHARRNLVGDDRSRSRWASARNYLASRSCDCAPNRLRHFSCFARSVNQLHPLRLVFGKLMVRRANLAMKLQRLFVEPRLHVLRPLIAVMRARQSGLHVDVDHQREVRHQPAAGDAIEFVDHFRAQVPAPRPDTPASNR